MIRVRVKDQTETFTLITIVTETTLGEKSLMGQKESLRAWAYVFNKDRKIKKFLADDLIEVEK